MFRSLFVKCRNVLGTTSDGFFPDLYTIKDKRSGSRLVFVVLNMDKDLQRERLEPRVEILGEKFNKILMKIEFEPATDDEENAIDLKITKDILLDDVVKMIMKTVK